MSDVEVAWLSGLFEGEGTFGIYRDRIKIQVVMTDVDVISRVKDTVGVGWFNPEKPLKTTSPSGGETKPAYMWALSSQAQCRDLLEQMLPYLGERRGAKAREMIALVDGKPRKTLKGYGPNHGTRERAYLGCECAPCATAKAQHLTDTRARYWRKKNEEA